VFAEEREEAMLTMLVAAVWLYLPSDVETL
jgi:hypothetical protein